MVVEEGEECDCGYIDDYSCRTDICCIGRNATSGCKRKPGKICRLVRFRCPFCLYRYGIHCADLRKH